ncbi:recombination-associated protein RdgC [Candidatus Methylospira mobilis]|uniref:recombination-associated protein RdgC n=1 Tax=Candidatus Methylospira mobilis TaxID=1808979 RepID=UPI0028E653B0|nr:recombination-associated protein RdgC [Candidatus Methylospira mobilis]WNV03685.1 recombination-associated protein RdgC [Candidatus Methylospira mobilis]
MWFKNLSLLRFNTPFTLTCAQLEEHLQSARFRQCSSLEPMSYGWKAPVGDDDAPLVHAANGFFMISAVKEEKILPASVVNDLLAERAQELELQRGTPVRRKERDALRDDIIHELLPRAFSHRIKTWAYLDPVGGWLIVDSSSSKKTEELASLLRRSIGTLAVSPPATQQRIADVLTRWLSESEAPSDIAIENECELRSPDEEGGIVRCSKQDLSAPEIQNHLQAGKEVVKLALSWSERLSFVLDEELGIRRLRFLDCIQEEAEAADAQDEIERFDVDFSIMTLELSTFLPRLLELFGGEVAAA